MEISDAGLDLIKKSEGLRLTAYPDPGTGGEPWTIGYGHTGGVQPGLTITEDEADDLLREDVKWAEAAVNSLSRVAMTDGQFSACVSLTFNIGQHVFSESTLLRKMNAGDMLGAANEFPKWCHAGNRILPGLVTRREAERKLFLSETTA